MLSPLILPMLLLIFLGLTLAVWAFFLHVGLRLVGLSEFSRWRLAGATALVAVLQLMIAVGTRYIPLDGLTATLLLTVVVLAVCGLIACLVIRKLFRIELGRALIAWLPTFVAPIISGMIMVLFFWVFLFKVYVNPTNSMAPTLLGWHGVGVCAECGEPAFGTIDAEYVEAREIRMICESHFHAGVPARFIHENRSPDRFLVANFLTPQRWDIIAFRLPEDPSTMYCKRLVGLPGEKITIRDGDVWANDKRLTPPEELRELQYISGGGEFDLLRMPMWGTVERPGQLGSDEYFVLGDFSMRSKDSRLFERGAPGRAPYAVPIENVVGVVTTIYWPPSRWRMFR